MLQPERFKDYGPNGLQVEGRPEIRKIVSSVTASRALIEAAIAAGADAVFVHHGLFWRGQDGCVTGWMKQRLALLLAHDVNLFAYHLPLDAHPELGNNAQLGAKLKLVADGRFGEQDLGFIGAPEKPLTAAALAALLQFRLGRAPTLVEGDGRPLKRVVKLDPNAAQAMKWVAPRELRDHEMPPADVVLVDRLIERSAA